MKALFELFRRFDARRIFGFIRRLGGMSRPKVKCYDWRSTRALRVEGDATSPTHINAMDIFLSTPSVWRATYHLFSDCLYRSDFYPRPPGGGRRDLSLRCRSQKDFYPRPPGGGRRRGGFRERSGNQKFLSTPSGWRATSMSPSTTGIVPGFLSTPSGWRATLHEYGQRKAMAISIHALRVEGDNWSAGAGRPAGYFYPRPPGGGRLSLTFLCKRASTFLSTPSGWRATFCFCGKPVESWISIHALRVEGDCEQCRFHGRKTHFYPRPPGGGRHCDTCLYNNPCDFYPRPPGGGRL